jgi:hypothetical protein
VKGWSKLYCWVSNRLSASGLLCFLPASCGFLSCLFFGPEDGGDIILRNINFQRNTWRYIPKDRTIQLIHHLLFKVHSVTQSWCSNRDSVVVCMPIHLQANRSPEKYAAWGSFPGRIIQTDVGYHKLLPNIASNLHTNIILACWDHRRQKRSKTDSNDSPTISWKSSNYFKCGIDTYLDRETDILATYDVLTK